MLQLKNVKRNSSYKKSFADLGVYHQIQIIVRNQSKTVVYGGSDPDFLLELTV